MSLSSPKSAVINEASSAGYNIIEQRDTPTTALSGPCFPASFSITRSVVAPSRWNNPEFED
jgi:hypothetical protein